MNGLLELISGFVGELRRAGLPVSLTENLDALEAVKVVPVEDREAFKYALGATLVKDAAHWQVFETIFEVYFSLRGTTSSTRATSRLMSSGATSKTKRGSGKARARVLAAAVSRRSRRKSSPTCSCERSCKAIRR